MTVLPIYGKMKTVPIKAEKPCRRETSVAVWNSAFPEMTSPSRSLADWAPAGQCRLTCLLTVVEVRFRFSSPRSSDSSELGAICLVT